MPRLTLPEGLEHRGAIDGGLRHYTFANKDAFLDDGVQVLPVEHLVLDQPLEFDGHHYDATDQGKFEGQFDSLAHQKIGDVCDVEAAETTTMVKTQKL